MAEGEASGRKDRNERAKMNHKEKVRKFQFEQIPKLRCPVCGYLELAGQAMVLRFIDKNGAPVEKVKCGNCYTTWLDKQIPDMKVVTNEEFGKAEVEQEKQINTLEEARKKRLEELQAAEKAEGSEKPISPDPAPRDHEG